MSADPRPRPTGPEIETIRALHTALASGRSLPACGCRTSTSPVTRPRCSAYRHRGAWSSSAADSHGASTAPAGRTAPWSSPPTRRPPSTPTARRSTNRTSCTPGSRSGATSTTPDAAPTTGPATPASTHDAFVTLLRAIHDDSVTDALDEFLGGRPVVGVMGGHALARGTRGYAGAARLGHPSPRRALVVATGGGPGAMEAANLGAFCARTRRRSRTPSSGSPRCRRSARTSRLGEPGAPGP